MKCPICKNNNTTIVYIQENMFFTDGKTSMDLKVAICEHCGYVFQSSAYTKGYDVLSAEVYNIFDMNKQFFFPRNDEKTLESLKFITDNINSNINSILEIGSSRGDFLYHLAQHFKCSCIGVEPTKDTTFMPTICGSYTPEMFSNTFDLIVLKHTLEHIKYPKQFLDSVKKSISDGGYLFIEVPSFDICQQYLLEDFVPEHVSYFSQNILLSMLNDMQICCVENSRFLRVIAKKIDNTTELKTFNVNVMQVKDFFKAITNRIEAINNFLEQQCLNEQDIVFYGVGLNFRTLFGRLQTRLNLQYCFFMDDSFRDDIEPYFGLKKYSVEKGKNCIVVICSNDYFVQDLISKKIDSIGETFVKVKYCRFDISKLTGV